MRKPVWSESEQKRIDFLRCADIPIFLHTLVVWPFAQPLTSVPSRLACHDLTTPCWPSWTNQRALGAQVGAQSDRQAEQDGGSRTDLTIGMV